MTEHRRPYRMLPLLSLIFLTAMEFPLKGEAAWQCSNCSISYEIVGCYKDKLPRRLPTEILNERDEKNKNFNGIKINWENWNQYMAEFACRCAAKAKQRGWTVFGLQHYGECWSGPDPESYKTAGKSDHCVGSNLILPCSPFDRHCVGKSFTNMVYRIVPKCEIKFEALGCYSDTTADPRPLPKLILTDRDESLEVSSGRTIDWRNFDVYVSQLACRCAQKAKEMGYTVFGLQNLAECWSGSKARSTYNKDGVSSRCVDQCFKPCRPSSKFCVGGGKTNFVYKLDKEMERDARVPYDTTQEDELINILENL